jgi:beta-xylosidase
MRWQDDWPVIGDDANGDGTGEPVLAHRKPIALRTTPTAPATSDDFDRAPLGPQWQWQANPQPGWATLDAPLSRLRLACVPRPAATLWLASNLLLQKFPAAAFQVTSDVELDARTEGDEAGLIVFGYSYAWIGVRQIAGALVLVHAVCLGANLGGAERVLHSRPVYAPRICLRAAVKADARCQFSYSVDGATFTLLDGVFQCTSSDWVGAKLGLFASSPPEAKKSGSATIDRFEIVPLSP